MGHCKGPDHVRADSSTSPGGHGPGYMSARYEAELDCPNKVPPGTTWGVVLTHTTHGGGTTDGMKLLPTAAAVLPRELRLAAKAAAASAGTVVIEHTVLKVWTAYVALTPAAAGELADAIEKAADEGPASTELTEGEDDDEAGTSSSAGADDTTGANPDDGQRDAGAGASSSEPPPAL